VFIAEVSIEYNYFCIKFIPTHADWKDSPAKKQTLDLLMVFTIHELDGLMLKKIIPKFVKYSLPLTDIREYERVMRCRPEILARENSITFDISYLNEPIITANYELQSVLLPKISYTAIPYTTPFALRTRIYNYLLANSYMGIRSVDDIAANFNISVRTLQRKLKSEKTSFQQISDDARKSIAINYLKAGNYPVKLISHLMGYNEISAFSRSFKRWTGTSPVSFQKNN
jgi:AraC-like DNA-binding protein